MEFLVTSWTKDEHIYIATIGYVYVLLHTEYSGTLYTDPIGLGIDILHIATVGLGIGNCT